jgi:hypothetical protein
VGSSAARWPVLCSPVLWRVVSDGDKAPEPTASGRDIRGVLIAGALQNAVFGLVRAALDRLTAKDYRRFTGYDFREENTP